MNELLPHLPPALAQRPEMRPLLWALCGREGGEGEAGGEARAAYRATLAQNLLLGAALDQVLDGLADARVSAQPLKGALFVETLYRGDAGARPMGDIDLLVPGDQLERAGKVLADLGFQPLGAQRARWSARFSHHRILRRGAVTIELHWKLCHELAIDGDAAAFFRETRDLEFRGRRLPIARDELQLFYILVHAATHGLLYSAVWIADAYLLARAAGMRLDWDYVERHAIAHRAARAVHAAARIVNEAFPGTLPGVNGPIGLRDRMLERALAAAATPLPYGPGLRSLVIRSLLTDRALDAARVLLDKAWLRLLEQLE